MQPTGRLHLSRFLAPGAIRAHPLFRALCRGANASVVGQPTVIVTWIPSTISLQTVYMHRPPINLHPCTTCAPYFALQNASVDQKVDASDRHETSHTHRQRSQTSWKVQIRIRNSQFPSRLAATAQNSTEAHANQQTQISWEPLNEK